MSVATTDNTTKTTTTTTLILVDCQNDFHPGGSLAIPTANEDAERIAQLIRMNAVHLDRIVATMDSHLKLHIAHPSFWYNASGDKHPEPFTIISARDIETGTWKPRSDLVLPEPQILDEDIFQGKAAVCKEDGTSLDFTKYCFEYATRLEAQPGRQFQICIWPEHCLIGSTGHALVPCIEQALHEWSKRTGKSVEVVLKGQHILTEMYSGLQADVPVSRDTALNKKLLDSLLGCEPKQQQQQQRILVCGQAMSHCVNYTVRDMVKHWPPHRTSEITILTDCASAVPGFESAAETFLTDMKQQGLLLMTADQAFSS